MSIKYQHNFTAFKHGVICLNIHLTDLTKCVKVKKGSDFVLCYNTLFSGTGKMYFNTGNDISREEYPNGYTIYAFDLTPDMCGSSPHFNVVQKGNLTIEIQFATAPAAAVSVVCYREFYTH